MPRPPARPTPAEAEPGEPAAQKQPRQPRRVDPSKVLAKATERYAGTVAELSQELAVAYTAIDDLEEENDALRAELVAATSGQAAA